MYNKYRKKPVEIEAVQFTKEIRDAHIFDGAALPDGVKRGAMNWHPARREVYKANFHIETLEVCMNVDLDDWIIKGVKGEFYPCKPDIFAATYEAATSQAPAVVNAVDEKINLLRDAIYCMLQQFTGTPSTLADSEARGKAHAALKATAVKAAPAVVQSSEFRKEWIMEAANYSNFQPEISCCDVPLKFCNSDTWKGNLEGFAKALLRIANNPTDPAIAQMTDAQIERIASQFYRNKLVPKDFEFARAIIAATTFVIEVPE